MDKQQSSPLTPDDEGVSSRMQLLRDLVNIPRVQRQLMANELTWFRLCSAMDALGDTEQAIAAHRGRAWESSAAAAVGLRYLAHYGLLQAAYVQQDSIKSICEVLGVSLDPSQFSMLMEIRELRNAAIGHPTGRKDGSSHAIVQISMTADRFELASWGRDGWTRRSVDLAEVTAEQRNGVIRALNQVIDALMERNRRHKERFLERPLSELMNQSGLDYALEKIHAGARVVGDTPSGGEVALAQGGLDVINLTLDKLESALRERDEFPDVNEWVDDLLTELHGAVDRLVATFAGQPDALDPEATRVYAFFVASKLKELQDVLIRIDQDYTSP